MSIQRIFILGLICFFSLSSTLFAQDKILAVVNNEIITQRDLEGFVSFMRMQLSSEYKGKALEDKLNSMREDMIEKLIEDKLILQSAKKEGIQVDQQRLQSQLERIKSKHNSETEFYTALKMQGLTQADIEKRIQQQILVYDMVDLKIKSEISVAPQEVTSFYNERKAEFIQPESRLVRSVSTQNLTTAKMAHAALNKKQESFEAVAKRFNLKINNHGLVAKGQFKQEIEEAIFQTKLKENSELVKFEGEYYIFHVGEITAEEPLDLSEVSDEIYNYLYEKKMQNSLKKWLNELKEKSYIEVKEN